MSASDIQTVINVFGVIAGVVAVWMIGKILKNEDSYIIENNDWVIDFCAGKPYKKGLK